MSDVYVLVPDSLGVSLVEMGALMVRLEDGEPLEDAASNAGIDSVSSRDPEALVALVERARKLNLA